MLVDQLLQLLVGGPEVLQVDRLAALADADRILGDVDLHRAGERVDHHQHRRGEVVGAGQRIDAALEVAIARQHRAHHQVGIADRLGDRVGQRAGIADARGAAVADEVVADLVEVLLQARRREILGDDLRARRQRGLDPRLHLQPVLDRVARDQAGAQHDVGIGGVGAGGDGGDHHVAMAEIVVGALALVALAVVLAVEFLLHVGDELLARLGERHAVLRALRPGEARLDVAEIERQRVGEDRLRRLLGAPQALLLGVGLDDLGALAAVGGVEIAQRDLVDREEAAGRAVLGRHVGDGGAIGQRQVVEALAVELDELVDHALLAQHLRHGEHQVGRGGAFLQLAGQLEADDVGNDHRLGLAQHRRFGLDAADAPAQHGETVHHGGVAVGADQRVGIERRSPCRPSAGTRPARGIRGSPGGRCRCRAARRGNCRTPSGPSAGTDSARDCARTRASRWRRTPSCCRNCRRSPNGR